MNGFDADAAMEARLRLAAARSPTPPLPAETAALPWSIQTQPRRLGLRDALRASGLGARSLGRGLVATARLGATVALAGGFLLLLGGFRGSAPATGDQTPVPGAIVTPAPAATSPAVVPGTDASPSPALVVVLPTSGTVDDVMADFVTGGIHRAESEGAAAVVVQLDTLGGSQAAMRRIETALHAKIPTIVWVGPPGAKAASAGTFITLSANLAYMAHSTNIGAASPVLSGGQDVSTLGQTEAAKINADAVAAIKSIAEQRHPEAVAWAVSTVEKAASYSSQAALDAKAINGIADSLDEVLAAADGQTVAVAGGQVTVHTRGARVETVTESVVQMILHTLDDPNIAFILLVLGVLALVVELFHPTLLVGLLGALSLALSFYGSGQLPLNFLAVVLIVLGILMIVLEAHVASHGLFVIAGIGLFVVGALTFYGTPAPFEPPVAVAWPIIAAMTAAAVGVGLVVVQAALRIRHRPVFTDAGMVGERRLLGAVGEARSDLAPLGTVYAEGESWSARSVDGEVLRGARVRVVGQDGLVLIVAPVEEER